MRLTALFAAIVGSVLLAPAVLAQNVFFQEGFDSGIPATWANIHLSGPDTWVPDPVGHVNTTPGVLHDYYCANGFSWRNNILLSPPIDLSGLSQVSFFCEQFQQFASSMVYNKIEVTTNNGQTYTVIKDLMGSPNGLSTVTADMSAFAGLPSVRVALHYQGAIANNWWADNVRVLTRDPVYSIRHLVAGSTARFEIRGVTPGSTVAIGLSSGPGPLSTPYGPLNMSVPIQRLPQVVADQNGEAFYDQFIPASGSGLTIYSQAVVLFPGGGFDRSNSLVQTVQ